MTNFNNKNILIVEDNPNLGLSLSEYLTSKKFKVSFFQTFKDALDFIKEFKPCDYLLALIDINLPDGIGLDLIEVIKEKNNYNDVIIFSAINEASTKISALELGASDYITKPFDIKELMFRINKLMQINENNRSNEVSNTSRIELDNTIKIGTLEINFNEFILKDGERKILRISQNEFKILKLFFQNPNKVLTRDQIIDVLNPVNDNFNYRTIDNYIVKFRKWAATDNNDSINFESIRGVGYKMILK